MGWSFIAVESGTTAGNGTTLDCDGALNVAAGDLLVGVAKWDGTDPGSNKIEATSPNINTFTLKAVQDVTNICMFVGYKLVADANAAATFRLTLGSNKSYRMIKVMQFRPDGGETTTLDAGPNPATAGSGDPISGTISPEGDDLVVVGGLGVFDFGFDDVPSEIGEVASDDESLSAGYGGIWHKIYTESQTNIAAAVTWDAGAAEWVCDILGFKSAVAGGISIPVVMHNMRRFGGM